jgi:sulfite exporter TauE/SafE
MQTELGFAGAFLVGLLGGVHCIGMCGGIVGALSFGLPAGVRAHTPRLLRFQLAYNLGRIASYVAAGAAVGGLGRLLAETMPVYYAQRILLVLAGSFMLLLGLYLGGWWYGLTHLERLGGGLWRRIEPIARQLLPVHSAGQALALGALWGWVPCGLVYSMLVWAASAGSIWKGAGLMLAFGLGTLPNLLLMGLAAGRLARWIRQGGVRAVAGGTVMLFGLVTLWQAW